MGLCRSSTNIYVEEHNHLLSKPKTQQRPKICDKYNEKELLLLDELFKDLAKRSPNDTVSKQTFLDYFALPGILGDRLFAVFDTNTNGVIDYVEFLTGLARYNQGSLQEKITMLFEMYDMDESGQINQEELSLILYTVTTPTTDIFYTKETKEDTNPIENISDVTKQMVDRIIKDAYLHFDTNHDGLLSKQQFSNWVNKHPETLKLLENALSKHQWDLKLKASESALSKQSGALYIYNNYKTEFISRYYVLKDKFLYAFINECDKEPVNVMFISGWYINKINDNHIKQGYYGIELTSPSLDDWKGNNNNNPTLNRSHTVRKREQILYCKTERDRDEWIKYLQDIAATVSISEYYNIDYDDGLLGKSHFCTVYRGIHGESGKKYAIKIVEKKNIDDEQRLSLRNEIAIMTLVNHPTLIQLWDVFADKTRIYMVLTLAPYGNFFQRWKKVKRYEEDIARKIIWKLLDAINYLRTLGIVHRDIKPENILCLHETDDTQIVLSDFGFSKFATPEAYMTMPCGTLCYVAPEVLSKKAYNYKVDLWSVGCVMHLLLRGILPFDGYTPQEIRQKTLNKPLNLTSTKWDSVTDDAKDLITKLLIKDPMKRISLSDALKHQWFNGELPVYGNVTATLQILAKSNTRR